MPRHHTPFQSRPTTSADLPTDPYLALIVAVIGRAVEDALGHGDIRGTHQPQDRVQREARSWLSGKEVETFLSLAGYEPEVILRAVRRVLGG